MERNLRIAVSGLRWWRTVSCTSLLHTYVPDLLQRRVWLWSNKRVEQADSHAKDHVLHKHRRYIRAA